MKDRRTKKELDYQIRELLAENSRLYFKIRDMEKKALERDEHIINQRKEIAGYKAREDHSKGQVEGYRDFANIAFGTKE